MNTGPDGSDVVTRKRMVLEKLQLLDSGRKPKAA